MQKDPDKIKHILFQSTDILIESDYHYLFNKCHEALRSVKVSIIEVNEIKGYIYAYRSKTFTISLNANWAAGPARIEVTVAKLEGSESTYQINLNYGKGDLLESSHFINRFINQLISKSTSVSSSPQTLSGVLFPPT